MSHLRLIGYWRSDREPHWPDPAAFVDEGWDRDERGWVAENLRNGQRSPWVAAGVSFCRLCGASNGSGELLDARYLWPEGLAHYVEEHAVRLPDEFLDHVRGWDSPEYWKDRIDRDWWRGFASTSD